MPAGTRIASEVEWNGSTTPGLYGFLSREPLAGEMMFDEMRVSAGAWGPLELGIMIAAYRAVLQEICDTGCLADLSNSPLSALEIRRLAARQVVVLASTGVRNHEELVARALSRLVEAEAAT